MRTSLLLSFAALAACARPPDPLPLVVEVAGCASGSESRCTIADAPLVLWIAGVSPARVAVTLDGAPLLPRESVSVQEGARLTLPVQPGALRVKVDDRPPWSLALAAAPTDPALAEVARLRRSGQTAQAEARLAQLDPALPGAAGQRARNALAAGRIEEAIAAFEAAIAEDVRLEARGRELDDRGALHYVLLHHQVAARDGIAAQERALEALGAHDAQAALDLEYVRLQRAFHERDVRAGLTHARQLALRAERLGQSEAQLDGRQLLASLLVYSGRWGDAQVELAAMRAALDGLEAPCKRAELSANLGWYGLLGHRQAPELFPALPLADLDRAVELYSRACDRPLSRANAQINRAWAALAAGDRTLAREQATAARTRLTELAPRSRLHLMHLDAELELAEGRPAAALGRFDALEAEARARGQLDLRWQAQLGRGRALEATGALPRALQAYRESEALLVSLAERVPLGEGRDGLLFERGAGAQRGVAVALALDDLGAAVALMRQARLGTLAWTRQLARPVDPARVRAVQEVREAIDAGAVADWTRPADEAEAARRERESHRQRTVEALDRLFGPAEVVGARPLVLPDDEAALLAHPLDQGMVVIVQRGGRLHAERVAARDRLPVLVETVPMLRAIRRLHLLVHPQLEQLDWGALVVDGEPLHARTAAVFRGDLRGPPSAAPAGPRRALVLADPARALPLARADAAQVQSRLVEDGWSVTLTGESDRARLVRALAAPLELFHYSGHGVQAGRDGLDSGIPLAGGQLWTVVDVLTSTAPPRRAVLAACDLGRRGSTAGLPGLGLAQALLAAGTDEVVAAVRPVDDAVTARWVSLFYEHVSGPSPVDWPEALRRTTVELGPEVDGAAFRVWTAD